jgi:hypothetical protein
MLVEQFECSASSNLASLKTMIQRRTRFPIQEMVLLLGCKRLHNELPMNRVAAAAQAAGNLQLHLAASGAYVFLRQEGQGHLEPSGPSTLTLSLPPCVNGARKRPLPFDPSHRLADFRLAVQAVSGLPLAGLRFSFADKAVSKPLEDKIGGQSLEALGVADGCTIEVTQCITEQDILETNCFDLLLDTPTDGPASDFYDRCAQQLTLSDNSRLVLFVGGRSVAHKDDLARVPLADGVVVSAHAEWSMQLSYSIFEGRRAQRHVGSGSCESAS